MARPLRFSLAGGWYYITNRACRGLALFLDNSDRRYFLDILGECPERFGVELHAFVLMDNHYDVVLRTLEPNLSQAMRWLHVNYSMRFKAVHRRRGPVFTGRFKGIIIQDVPRLIEVVRYVHLNPVRSDGLGADKTAPQRAKTVSGPGSGAALAQRRLKLFHNYRWSSWRIYSGTEPAPAWLDTEVVSRACGGRNRAEQRAALTAYTEEPVRQGQIANPWARVIKSVVLGDEDFAKKILQGRLVDVREKTLARKLGPRVEWKEVVRATESLRHCRWAELSERHGDWTRDGAMYFATRYGRQGLAEVVRQLKGLQYQAAAQAVRRFGTILEKDPERQRFVAQLKRRFSTRIWQ